MKVIYIILCILIICSIFFLLPKSDDLDYYEPLLNIYNEPLQPCKKGNMKHGSWDNDGKCSEMDGGVHQICIKRISKNAPQFSKTTGQSDWSDKREKNNHCVCLGAWSLYNAKKDNIYSNILNCDAIPNSALSLDYVDTFSEGWNKWNGLEIKDQIKDGVESLVSQCMNVNKSKKQKLIKNYCTFAKNVEALKNSVVFTENCLL